MEFKYKFEMFESKVTSRSGWGEMTSINASSAPGFVPIPCPSHPQYSITNICKALNCIQPLCPECVANHVQLHQQNKKPAKIQNIITTRTTCIEQLARMKYDTQKQIDQCVANSSGNVEQFVEAHQKRLDTAYKKIIKMVDDIFTEMNKQMQVISNAYLAQKEKKERQVRMKLSPLNDFLISITDYKQELESNDYIPALIELLHEPPRKPKYEQPSEGQNYGSVEINEKYLEDIKTNIGKFVHVVVNCKDEGFKARVEMNKSNIGGSNNMKFSRFQRQRSRDGSESKISESRRSNSKKKIFGCESIISDIKPGSQSRIQINNNSIYQGLNENQGNTKFYPSNQQKVAQQIKYSSYTTPIKISKHSYFSHNDVQLWYFKGGSKSAFRAPLQSIQAGFERVELKINFLMPQNHRTLVLPDGTALLIGGDISKDEATTNKAYYLNEQDLTLRQISPMIKARSLFGVCFAQDSVFVAGGICCQINKWTNRKVLADAERYSLRQKRWQKITSLPEPAYDFSMHALGSAKIIKLGGLAQSRTFLHKVDIYQISRNSWSSFQVDNRFVLAKEPGIVQISGESILIFGGMVLPDGIKTSKCYMVTEEQPNGGVVISEGPQLYNEATFQSAFIHEGCILAIQNNEVANRNKLIMGYKYNQWKFISC